MNETNDFRLKPRNDLRNKNKFGIAQPKTENQTLSTATRQSPHNLQTRVDRVGRRARFLMLVGGLAILIAIVAATSIGLGVADYFSRIEDVGVRIIFSLLLVASAGAAFFFFLLPAITNRLDAIGVARLIETRFPQLGDRLTSTLQFLHEAEDEPTAGSAALRRAVVAETTAATEDLNFGDIVRTTGVWRVVMLAVGVLIVGGVLLTLRFEASKLALHRLVAPVAAPAWPRLNNLKVAEGPSLVSKGADWRLKVVDQNNRLPVHAEIQYQFLGDKSAVETRTLTPLAESLVFQLPAVTRSFRFRVQGGDDDTMNWRKVEVVQPPVSRTLTVEVLSPDYLPFAQTSQQEGAIKATLGSTIRITGTASKPIASCRVTVDMKGKRLTFAGAVRGEEFQIPPDSDPAIQLTGDGKLTVDLVDQRGIVGSSTLHISASPDQPPTVTLQQPRGSQYVTRNARIAIEAIVKEDTALHAVEVIHHVGDDADRSISILPADALAPTEIQQTSDSYSLMWDLAEEPDLAVGQTIILQVVAADYLPSVGESSPVRLTIVSEAEMIDRLGRDQSLILNQLEESLALQQTVRSRLGEVMIQFSDVAEFNDEHSQRLQSAELSQRQINNKLAQGDNSAASQVEALLSRIEQNRIDAPAMQRRLKQLQDTLNSLASGPLPTVSQDLLDAVKSARLALAQSPDRTAKVNDSLKRSTESAISVQDEVIAQLQALVGDLSQWEDYRRFGREIRDIQAEQKAIAESTAAGRASALTRDPSDWSPQEIADLRKLALRQSDLAKRFETLQQRMTKTRDDLNESQPLAAEVLSDAIDVADRFALNGQMREGGRLLGNRKYGEASGVQAKVLEGFSQMLDALANRREHELSRQGDKLDGAAADVVSLADKQRLLRDKFKKAAATSNAAERRRQLERLAKEQQELAEEAKRIARRLERLRAEKAKNAMQQAGSSMNKAAAASQQGDANQSQQNADQAAKDLEDVARQIKSQQQQIEKDLFEQQMAKLQPTIEAMVKRQSALVNELQRLQTLADDQGELSRAQQASTRTLARQQRQIAGEVSDLAEKIAAAKAFALGLTGASREMERVAAQLDRLDLGQSTTQSATSALARLEQLVKALKKVEASGDSSPSGGTGQNGPQGDSIRRLSELKLMQFMQEELNLRTQQLETARVKQGGALTPEQSQARLELADEQGKLAELMLELLNTASESPEDNPDALPPIKDDIDEAIERLLETDESQFE